MRPILLAVFAVSVVACSAELDSPVSAGGGSGAGNGSSGGASGATGASGGNAGTTTVGGGGQTSNGGVSTGGNSVGASTGGVSGSAVAGAGGSGVGGASGSMSGGAGGAAGGGSGAGGGGSGAPEPSAGCNKTGSAVGSAQSPLTVSGHQYYVKLPTQYDAKKPYPVLFVFHPTGNPISWAEQNAGYEKNGAQDAAIRVYPAAANNGSGWQASDVAFFGPLYEKVTGDYCVDKARAFAAGESSGGDFSSILGCEHADKLRAIAPCATKDVGQYPLNASTRKCTGQVAAIIIHGKNDNVVGPANGPKTRDFYAALNHCGTTTTPVTGYTDTLSNCVQYQGCDAQYPVYWCQHTDPEYSGTNHGWPKFAGKMTWETFSKY